MRKTCHGSAIRRDNNKFRTFFVSEMEFGEWPISRDCRTHAR
jgi:hypothetical protein